MRGLPKKPEVGDDAGELVGDLKAALNAMVEAMAGEFRRQTVDQDGDSVAHVSDDVSVAILIDGRFDLEKVARAGLEAEAGPLGQVAALAGRLAEFIADPTDDVERSLINDDIEAVNSMIDAILKDQP